MWNDVYHEFTVELELKPVGSRKQPWMIFLMLGEHIVGKTDVTNNANFNEKF